MKKIIFFSFPLLVILFSAFIMLQLILFIPGLRKIFSFGYPGVGHFISSLIGSVSVLLILEAIKYIRYRKNVKKTTLLA